jgi:hypothetical protein
MIKFRFWVTSGLANAIRPLFGFVAIALMTPSISPVS